LLSVGISTLLLFVTASLTAQQLGGVWSGKISRRAINKNASVESLEMQLSQFGNHLWGHSFAFKDTSRFVLYRIEGKRNKKQSIVQLGESGNPAYILPPEFYPCEKIFKLQYFKVGNTQYLSGTWGGKGAYGDTTCFPNEELMVVLQKIKNPDYPIEFFVQQKLLNYFTRPRHQRKLSVQNADSIQPEYLVQTETPSVVEDSSLTSRSIDIQHIIQVKDSVLKITLYDNAIVDDDTVTIFVNKKPVLVRQRISTVPLTFYGNVPNPNQPVEILMQAENLGSIPPNTALMIIECGESRYEIRLRSGFEKHAAVIISYNPK